MVIVLLGMTGAIQSSGFRLKTSRPVIKDIGYINGKGFRTCLDVASDGNGRCVASFLRIKTLLDIFKPLRRGAQARPV